jgi:hypothetical protein
MHKSTNTACVQAKPPRFELGKVVATPGALRLLEAHSLNPLQFLSRHAHGDWGDVCPEDAQANDRGLIDDDRLLSAYALPGGERVWVLTECDRSVTTVLLPGEY